MLTYASSIHLDFRLDAGDPTHSMRLFPNCPRSSVPIRSYRPSRNLSSKLPLSNLRPQFFGFDPAQTPDFLRFFEIFDFRFCSRIAPEPSRITQKCTNFTQNVQAKTGKISRKLLTVSSFRKIQTNTPPPPFLQFLPATAASRIFLAWFSTYPLYTPPIAQ